MADQATLNETKTAARPPAYGVLGLLMERRELAERNARAAEETTSASTPAAAWQPPPRWAGDFHESY